jgi:CelD/BcsL family acetyltransferase involved in cellulose biosynthesis
MGEVEKIAPLRTDLKLEVKYSSTWIFEYSEEINDLGNRSLLQNPYFSAAWLLAWWKRLEGKKRPVILVVRGNDNSILGLWPFVEKGGLLACKGLWPFVYDEANYFHPLAESCAIPVLIDGLCNLLKEYTFAWVPLMRTAFWEEFLQKKVAVENLLKITRVPRVTSLIEPSANEFEDFWNEKMGGKTRKSFRYDQKSLADQGCVTFETWETFEDVRAMMPSTCMVEVESRKSKEGVGLYSIRGKRAFFFELLPELAKVSLIRLSILRVEEQPVAWQLDLLGKDYLAVHHLSFDEKWKKYSPGRQLLRMNVEKAWQEGRAIDFLPGFFDYKEKLSTATEQVRELHWFRRSFRGWLACRLIRWNMRVRKKIRQKKVPTSKASKALRKAITGEPE